MNINIGNKTIGEGFPCFLIAEAGVNHNGSLDLAKKMIDAAANANADAIKFQAFSADRLALKDTPLVAYQKKTTQPLKNQHQLLKQLELGINDFRNLKKHCENRGIIFLSSPFDEINADEMQEIGVDAYKIPSGEITNIPLLIHIARKGKPVILSTGMATLCEVESAVQIIEESGNGQIVLLQCTSEYPADPSVVNLRAMLTLKSVFNYDVGFSDHTIGIEVPLAAVAMGAKIIEKHFTLDRNMPGPDHQASIDESELRELVNGVRKVEIALGDGRKWPSMQEVETSQLVRKSIISKKDINAGEMLTLDNIGTSRPGDGLPPSLIPFVLGKKAKEFIKSNSKIFLDQLL